MVSSLWLAACGSTAVEASRENGPVVTYPMGQTVQVGPLTYTVLETNWKSQFGGGPAARIPKHRFLLVRLTITNSAGQSSPVPEMSLMNAAGQTFPEITEGVEDVPKWLGVLRNLTPVQTEQGVVVFDAPIGAYKLEVRDGSDVLSEKKALIELPLQLE